MSSRIDQLRRRHRGEESDQGFTLIELLIVVVILGILAAIVVFAVQNLSGQSAQAACSSDVRTVESALELYRAQTGIYPGDAKGVNTGLAYATQAQLPSLPTTGGHSQYSFNHTTPQNFDYGVDELLSTYAYTDSSGATAFYGPWLKEAPRNINHYEVWVSYDGEGKIQVYNSNGTATVPATGNLGTAADCSSVQ